MHANFCDVCMVDVYPYDRGWSFDLSRTLLFALLGTSYMNSFVGTYTLPWVYFILLLLQNFHSRASKKKTIMIVKYPYIPWGFLACSIFITYCNAQYYPIAGVTTGINSNTKARPFRQDINDLQNNIEQWWASLQWMLLLCIISTIQLLIST